MRPAQKAPENYEGKYYGFPLSSGFNEAGAKSAGKLPDGAEMPGPVQRLQ